LKMTDNESIYGSYKEAQRKIDFLLFSSSRPTGHMESYLQHQHPTQPQATATSVNLATSHDYQIPGA
jgi:hypothetical protein